MKIILIGAGNLATNLGKALKKAGHDILQVYSRTATSAETLATVLGCPATTDLTAIDNRADVYILSIKDKALREVVAELTHSLTSSGTALAEKVFLHTAGSMPLNVFKDKAPHYGVFYPMQTFSKAREVDFSIIPTFIEWNDETAHTLLAALAQSISRRVYPLSTADRKYLHLSAVWACNFVNHCYDIDANILAAHHLPFDVMLPLIDETARKVHSLSPHDAQTGPAVRYDENVIAAQSALMADDPELQQLYELLSKSIHRHAKNR